ncbi:MAG: hypothetical protein UT33_C0009G0059 [Candidatus Peregrinibacteria bacterium GW2011_GWC2_39_14]|nr:MAG: hypothetical protein US92_C0005G0059 [Candidatus Peregrinibacteria bacterium GW2011_GWA2_38_36]KKR06608.1 MAG: hypothetical protein UT33_C0009G0059 [Candidatus Peregrinibacteria bacterium GW2011_GWC2_39_14]
MKKQKISRSPKVSFSIIVTAFVVAVIALSFFIKPDFIQGLIMKAKISPKTAVVVRPPQIPDALGGKLDMNVMNAVKAEFQKQRAALPKKMTKLSDKDVARINVYNSLKRVKFGKKDDDLLRRKTALIMSAVGNKKIADDLKKLLLVTGTAVDVSKKIKEYTDTLPWNIYGDALPIPQNFILAFKYPAEYAKMNTANISVNTPKFGTLFGACVVGNQAMTINSASFESRGEPGIPTAFQGYYLTWDAATNSYKGNQFWPSSMESWGSWNGNVTLPVPIKLDPNGPQQCTVFGIAYQKINQTPAVGYNQFSLTGLRNQIPGDIITAKIWTSDMPYLMKVGNDSAAHGVIDLFDYKNQVGFIKYNEDPPSPSFPPINSEWVYFGSTMVRTYGDSYAEMSSMTVELESTYDDNTVIKGNFYINSEYSLSDNIRSKNLEVPATLHKGLNTIPVNLSFYPGANINMHFMAEKLPGTVGKLQTVYKGFNTTAEQVLSYPCWHADIATNSCSAVPFVKYPTGEINVVIPDVGDSTLDVTYYPYEFYSWANWFDKYSIGPEANSIFQLNLSGTAPTPDMEVGPIKIKVLGNFTQSMGVHIRVMRGNLIDPNASYEVNSDMTVLPGSIITIDKVEVGGFGSVNAYIIPTSVPGDSLLSPKYIKFLVEAIPAKYKADGYYVHAGDVVPTTIHPVNSLPIASAKTEFGDNSLFVYPGYSGYPRQDIDLSRQGNNGEFTVNASCFTARGQSDLYSFTYSHWEEENSPFKDIILDAGFTKIYYNNAIPGIDGIVKWTPHDVTFTLTNPKRVNNGDAYCLNLNVLPPTVSVPVVWFNLKNIEAKDTHGVAVKDYVHTTPSTIELKDENIPGAVYSFNCSAFDANGVCLY